MTHEEFQERIVDYLYGALEGDALAGFEAAMAGHEAWRREVDALARALRVSRSTLVAAREAAPRRVHVGVLEAARRKAAELARKVGGAHAVGVQKDTPGFFDAILAWFRQPWAVPALAAVAVITVLVARRDLFNSKEMDDAITSGVKQDLRKDQNETATRSSAPAVEPERTAVAPEPAATAPVPEEKVVAGIEKQAEESSPAADEGAAEGAAQGADREPHATRAKRKLADPGSLEKEARAQIAAEPFPAEAPAAAPPLPTESPAASAGTGRRMAAPPAHHQANLAASKDVEQRYASPPAGWAGKARDLGDVGKTGTLGNLGKLGSSGEEERRTAKAPVADELARAPAKNELFDKKRDGFEGAGGPAPKPTSVAGVAAGAKGSAARSALGGLVGTGTAPSAPATPPPAQPASVRGGPAPVAAPSRQPSARAAKPAFDEPRARADDSEASVEADAAENKVAPSLPDLLRRAEDLRKQGRFEEVVVIYRDLIRRFPRDRRVEDWNRQIAMAREALARVRPNRKAATEKATAVPADK